MKSSHQILTDIGIDSEKVYPDDQEQDAEIIDRYGMPVGYYYNVSYTVSAFLIEILTLYKEQSDEGNFWKMYSDGSRVYIPEAKKKHPLQAWEETRKRISFIAVLRTAYLSKSKDSCSPSFPFVNISLLSKTRRY